MGRRRVHPPGTASCNANIPTEEVFTTPHARKVSGHVVSSKPLSYQGSLIDNIAVKFEEGRIVDAKASRGEEVLNKVLDTDEGARRLGEVALVPHSSPISKSGLLFFNTLFDENAACHIALGQCYSKCFVDGGRLTPEQIAAQGGNKSFIHIDWMIGSDKLDIDGIHNGRPPGAGVPQGASGPESLLPRRRYHLLTRPHGSGPCGHAITTMAFGAFLP